MALLKTLAMPVQAQACEDSLMVSQNNFNGSPKFRLKVWKKCVNWELEQMEPRLNFQVPAEGLGHFTKYQVHTKLWGTLDQ